MVWSMAARAPTGDGGRFDFGKKNLIKPNSLTDIEVKKKANFVFKTVDNIFPPENGFMEDIFK